MKDFRSLKVWEKAHASVLDIYRETASFPADERFGLTSQVRRASVSIPSNIAEGCGRGSDIDFARFVQIAIGSSCELEYQLLLAHDLQYLDEKPYEWLTGGLTDVRRMLISLQQRLRER
jgi:four helix bundle protein